MAKNKPLELLDSETDLNRCGAFHNDIERQDWYHRMRLLEAAFAKAGIKALSITPGMACRWRKTGKIGPTDTQKAALEAAREARKRNRSATVQDKDTVIQEGFVTSVSLSNESRGPFALGFNPLAKRLEAILPKVLLNTE